jgi:hypothetical protein
LNAATNCESSDNIVDVLYDSMVLYDETTPCQYQKKNANLLQHQELAKLVVAVVVSLATKAWKKKIAAVFLDMVGCEPLFLTCICSKAKVTPNGV